jgi:hypothetical protein
MAVSKYAKYLAPHPSYLTLEFLQRTRGFYLRRIIVERLEGDDRMPILSEKSTHSKEMGMCIGYVKIYDKVRTARAKSLIITSRQPPYCQILPCRPKHDDFWKKDTDGEEHGFPCCATPKCGLWRHIRMDGYPGTGEDRG